MATTTESSTDGPVLSVVSKRIRALRKKYNRITQMEEALASGKTLNKEQEEVLRSKPIVTALIDELEKLRSPLTSALAEEVHQTSDQKPKQSDRSLNSDELIEDLLRLVYFGSLFDVRSQSEFTAMMLTRSHERGCCLTYDYVTDDEVDLLSEKDLNLISVLGSLVTSRPVNVVVSHKSALEACIRHAKQWLSSSDQPINPDVPASYAGLKEKLKKIISSDFFTATPEMKAPVEVAAAVGQLHISEDSTVPSEVPSEITEGDISTLDNKEEQENSQSSETYTEHQSEVPDEPAQKDEAVDVNPSDDLPPVQNEQQNLGEADIEDQDHDDSVPKDQQFVTSGRRSYPNGRGGGRGGGGRRPYPNGRGGGGHGGGRGGGGGYSNGGRGYYQDSNYQPRGYYNNKGRGGGGRSGGGRSGGGGPVYNRQGGSNGGHATAATS